MKKFFIVTFLTLLLINAKSVQATDGNISIGNISIGNIASGKQIINAKNVTITEERLLALLNAGYTLDEIYNMDLITYNNANLTNSNIALTTKYLKTTTRTIYGNTTSETVEVTEEEYLNSSEETISTLAQGRVETTYKILTTTVEKNGSYMKHRAYLYWKNMPSARSYDIMGLGYQTALINTGIGVNFTQLYTSGTTTYSSVIHRPKSTSTGVGAVFELPDVTISTLVQELYFNATKINPNNTITSLQAAGDYSHATREISSDLAHNNYNVNYSVGIVLGSAITSYYDSMSAANVYWDGTW